MKTQMLYQTQQGPEFVPGSAPYWIGRVILGQTATPEEVAAAVAGKMRLAASDILYVYVKTGETVREILQSGRNVSLDWVAFTISLTGSFEKSNSPFTPGQNALLIRSHARSAIRDCLAGVTPRNATGGLKAAILSVMDNVLMQEGIIAVPSKVLVAGDNILIDPTHDDEGVWLVTKDGDVAATPAVLANDASTLDLDFGELPPDGTYTLVVKARTGASTDLAPAVARRAVTVQAS